MARAFAGARSMKALGTYNFAGDLGKMTVPAVASLLFGHAGHPGRRRCRSPPPPRSSC
jgi:hypothetical protein